MIFDIFLFASTAAFFTYFKSKTGESTETTNPTDITELTEVSIPVDWDASDASIDINTLIYQKLLSGNVNKDVIRELSENAISRFVEVGFIPECVEDRIVEILLRQTIPTHNYCNNSFESIINNYTTQTIEIMARNKLPIKVVTTVISYLI